MAASMEELRRNGVLNVLELYSGIGGMHYALRTSGIAAEAVGAVDINDLANKVYRHNFPHTNLMQRSIEGITQAEFTKWDTDMLLMSPPCQPFTRQGLKGDHQDARTKSFFYVMDMLPRLSKTPCYILVENVKGFETSKTREYLIQTLEKCNYVYEEFLLSPVHLGIPNQRLRYFLLAKKRPLQFAPIFHLLPDCVIHGYRINSAVDRDQNSSTSICENLSSSSKQLKSNDDIQHNKAKSNVVEGEKEQSDSSPTTSNTSSLPEASLSRTHCVDDPKSGSVPVRTYVLKRRIHDYLEDLDDDGVSKYLLSDKVLTRYGRLMDIVTVDDGRTMCFTKGYGHKAEGSGSVLQVNNKANCAEAFGSLSQDKGTEPSPEVVEKLRSLQLRYFTPREIARLHHLPDEFGFPADVTRKQCYRVLGNSLNAYVVSVLLQYLVMDD